MRSSLGVGLLSLAKRRGSKLETLRKKWRFHRSSTWFLYQRDIFAGTLSKKWPFYGSSTWFLYQRDIFVKCPGVSLSSDSEMIHTPFSDLNTSCLNRVVSVTYLAAAGEVHLITSPRETEPSASPRPTAVRNIDRALNEQYEWRSNGRGHHVRTGMHTCS
jgi:hypothetical protein